MKHVVPLVLFVLLTVVGCGGETEKRRPQNREDAVTPLLARWEALSDSAKAAPRLERGKLLRGFLAEVTLTEIHDLCRDDGAETDSGRSLVRGFGDYNLVPVEDLVDLLTDEEVREACRERVVRIAQTVREELPADEADRIAHGLLAVADRDAERSNQYEVYAAQFGRDEKVRERIAAALAAEDDERIAQGVAMARESRDEAVTELLMGTATRLSTDVEAHPKSLPLLLTTVGSKAGARALPLLEPILRLKEAPPIQNTAVLAMGEMPATVTVDQLLRLHPDYVEGFPESAREARLAAIHRAARSLEAFLCDQLVRGGEHDADLALRLLERATAVGPMVQPGRVVAALQGYGQRPFEVDEELAATIIGRIEPS